MSALAHAIPSSTPGEAAAYLSPCHALYLDGQLIPVGSLVNGLTIVVPRTIPKVLEYFHIELFEPDVIYAEGAPTETFLPYNKRRIFDNRGEYEDLYAFQQLSLRALGDGDVIDQYRSMRLLSRASVVVAVHNRGKSPASCRICRLLFGGDGAQRLRSKLVNSVSSSSTRCAASFQRCSSVPATILL
jgi:Hint domain